MNEVKKIFLSSYNWVCPPGVTSVYVNVINPLSSISTHTGSGYCSLFRSVFNRPYFTGNNGYGMSGDGTIISKSSPVAVIGSNQYLTRIHTNGLQCFGLDETGKAYGWGRNAAGNLGIGDTVDRSSPVAISGGLSFFDLTTTAYATTYGLSEKLKLYSWGPNSFGNLGDGTVTTKSIPTAVLGNYSVSQYSISPSGYTASLVTTTGAGYSWGYNANGELGVGDVVNRSSPVAIVGSGVTWSKIVCGESSFGIDVNGNLYSWGLNTNGQLGLGDTTPRSYPTMLVSSIKFSDIVLNSSTVIAVDTKGKVYTWGQDPKGILVPGPKSTPVAVLGDIYFKKVIANAFSVHGLTDMGEVYSWGYNLQGNLGTGDTIFRSSPVLVTGSLKWCDIAVGYMSTYGVADDGQLYAWGQNDKGQLGVGDTVSRSSPVAILGDFGASYIPIDVLGQSSQIRKFSVTPGTTYRIHMGNSLSLFNNNIIGYGKAERIEIYYNI